MSTALAPVLDLWDPTTFEHSQRIGKLFASSVLIPEHMRNKLPDVTIALMMARRLNEDPLIVMQNIHVVSGKAGWSAQYIIARTNRSGVFKGRINWRQTGKGDDLEVTAYAVLAESGEEVSFPVSMRMARDEGWTRNAKYKSMPELMLRYRSAAFLVRLYAPEVMLGVPTIEEVEDVAAAAPPARVVLQAATAIPALEDVGTSAGQLAAMLGDAPTVIDVGPAPTPAPTPKPADPAPSKPAPRPQPADPEHDALATRRALEGMSGRIPHAIVRTKAREALHLARMSDERYAAAIVHGAGAGWWTAGTEGLTLAGGEPQADRWAALGGDDLMGAVADALGALGDAEGDAVLRSVGLTDADLDTATGDTLRALGRACDAADARLRAQAGE